MYALQVDLATGTGKNRSVISQEIVVGGHNWGLVLQIDSANNISPFMFHCGSPEKHLLHFSSVLFEILVREEDSETTHSTRVFFSYSRDQGQLVGRVDALQSMSAQVTLEVKVINYNVHSACMHLLSLSPQEDDLLRANIYDLFYLLNSSFLSVPRENLVLRWVL